MAEIKGYHAHVYYNADTRKVAEVLRETIIRKFSVESSASSDEPRGPHPISQFNVIFQTEEFQKIVPWLMLNREGLDVLIHPLAELLSTLKNPLVGAPVPGSTFCGRPNVPSCADQLRGLTGAILLPARLESAVSIWARHSTRAKGDLGLGREETLIIAERCPVRQATPAVAAMREMRETVGDVPPIRVDGP